MLMGILLVTTGLFFYPQILQCTGNIWWRWELKAGFSELQNSKWTERALVLARVWWACDHCTVHYWYNCIYSAVWSTTIISIPMPMSEILTTPESALGNMRILEEEHYNFNNHSKELIMGPVAMHFLPSGSNQSLHGTMPTIQRFPAVKWHVTV